MNLKKITYADLKNLADVAFIALHGRPGEDGALQQELEKIGLPYNGSGVASSQVTINKYETNEILAQNGIAVARHALLYKKEYLTSPQKAIQEIEAKFSYPFICKPADDGCSSAVKKYAIASNCKPILNKLSDKMKISCPKPRKSYNSKQVRNFPVEIIF